MEFRYSIQPTELLLRLDCWGPVAASDLIGMMGQITADPQYHPQLRAVVDLRAATGEWDYSEVQSFRDYLVRIRRGHEVVRWGAVTSAGTLVAACHVVILITDPQECGIHMRLFEDLADAERWVLAGQSASTAAVALQA